MDGRTTADEDLIAHLHMAAQHDVIGHDDPIAHLAIMADMGAGHEHAISADHGVAAPEAAAMDGDMLTQQAAWADLASCGFALVFEVLRRQAHRGIGRDLHTLMEDGVAINGDMADEGDPLAQFDIGTDGAEGPDRHAGCDARAGGNDGRGVDLVHRSRIMAAKVASATTRPSTVASPLNFHTLMRRCTFVTLMRSWSPGTTGRRNFALSIDMK